MLPSSLHHRILTAALLLLCTTFSSAASSDTIPCTHRYAEAKVMEIFNYIQSRPETKTEVKALKLGEVTETAAKHLDEIDMLSRYCTGVLDLSNGKKINIRFKLASRESYRRERAEDLEACWDDRNYGRTSVRDKHLGCETSAKTGN